MKLPKIKWFFNPILLLVILISSLYWQFFIQGKIPIPTDTLVGAYYPWLDYKWGFPAGVPVKNAPISDIYSQIYLWKNLGVQMLRSGQWPLWNSYSLSGTPLLANYQSSPFFPLNVLLLLPNNIGWALFIFLQTLVAALGMYFLLGKFVLKSTSKIAGSLVFCLSGLMSSYVEFGIPVWAVALLPWTLYFLILYGESLKIRYLSLITIAFASIYLAGHAQLSAYCTLIFFVFTGFWFKNQKINKIQLGKIFLFWFLGLGFAAIQLLPSFDLIKSSIRENEAYLKLENYGLSPVYEAIRLIAADFFGNPATTNHWDNQSYHELTSFLGTLTLPMIVPLFFKRFRDKMVKFWGVIFLISIFMAFRNPFTEFFYSLPLPLLTYSAATRILFITSFSAAILIALAMEKYQTEKDYSTFVKKSAIVFLSILLGIALGVAGIKIFLKSYIQFNQISVTVSNFDVTLKNLVLPIGILMFLAIATSFKKPKNVIAFVIVAVIFFDLGRYFLKYNPFVPNSFLFPITPVIEYLQKQPGPFRISRINPEIIPPNTWMAYDLQSIEGYDPLALQDYAAYFNTLNGSQYQGRTSRFIEVSKYKSNFLNALNTKYLLAIKKGEDSSKTLDKKFEAEGYKAVFEDKNSVALLNPFASERAYFVDKVTFVKNKGDLINKLNDPLFNPLIEAVVVDDKEVKPENSKGEVQIVDYTSSKIILKTKMNNSGFLVLAESYEKNWNLLINQEPAKLYEVNGALRGMFVPSGKSNIELNYQPQSFLLGLKISLMAMVSLILLNVFSLVKRRW